MTEKYTLLEGSCLDLIKEIPDDSVDMPLTDPPYFLGMTHNGQRGVFEDLNICQPFFMELLKEIKRVLKKDTATFYWFCDWRGYAFYYPIIHKVIGADNLLVWDKGAGPGSFYTFEHELIIFHTNNRNFHVKGARNIIREIPGFSMGAKKTDDEKVHPTQKPVALLKKLILDGSKEDGAILDCFMGSGSTGVACVETRRRFFGIEISENYFEIANTRVTQAFKKQLVKEEI